MSETARGGSTTLVLIQLDNSEELFTGASAAVLDQFLEEFYARVRRFSRSQDRAVWLNQNRVCIFLRGVVGRTQVDLAGAKLSRLFEPAFVLGDEEFRAQVHAAFVLPGIAGVGAKARLSIAERGLVAARDNNVLFVVRQCKDHSTSVMAVKRIREIERGLHQGEFVMYFQPKVRASDRTVVGAEALMRWDHPQRGILSPGEFIPYIAGAGVNQQLTWFAIKASIAQLSQWPAHLSVAVNVSPTLLLDPALVPNIEDALSVFAVDSQQVTVEITEDAVVQFPEESNAVLSQLRHLGAHIALDDFGTGYSSFANFRDLPVDELKIDRSFVQHMDKSQKDHELVKAIVDFAHNFGMQVVAEGVEDMATADMLEKLGVEYLQGYHLGRPVPADDFVW